MVGSNPSWRKKLSAKVDWRRKKVKILGRAVSLLSIIFILSIFSLIISFAIFAKDLPSPTKLTNRNIEQATKIFDRAGVLLFDVYGNQNRTLVTLDQIPKSLKDATIAIEDKNFYKHKGFDPTGIIRAIERIVVERKLTGGSTLTQQLVKNALLSSERTITRKIKEFILATQIERRYSKDEILQIYLNEVPYGGTAWGVEAASNLYFGKHASDLNLVESSILAGLPQKPTAYSPFGANPKAYLQRSKDVLRRMREDGYISNEQEKEALKDLENVKFAESGQGIKAPHFVLYVKEQLIEKYGEEKVQQGGLKVTTTLDWQLQEKSQEIVANEIEKAENKNLKVGNGGAIVQNSKTGEILVMVGSKDYFAEDYDGNVNVTISLRQPGSAIKPVNYVTGFKKGFTPATLLLDKRTEFPGGEGKPPYVPDNYDGKFHGPVPVRFALGNSYNLPAVKMLAAVGVKDMIETAKDLGINTFTDESRYGLSLTLGGGEVKLIELTNAFSAFSNGGKRVDPVTILKVTDNKGKVLEEFKPTEGRQVLTPEHAYLIADILSDKNAKYDAFGASSVDNILSVKGKVVATKTGTTDDKRDNWTIGFSPAFTTGVWVGNNDNSPMHPRLSSGITGAAPIWHRIMTEVLKNEKDTPFKRPDGIVEIDVDRISGLLIGPYSETRKELFAKWQVPQRVDDMHKIIKICKTTGQVADSVCIATGQAEDKVFLVMYDSWEKNICDPCPPGSDYSQLNLGAEGVVVQIQKPLPNETLGSQFNLLATVIAPNAIEKVEFYFDNTLVTTKTAPTYETTVSLSPSITGSHTVKVIAYTSDGKTATSEITVIIKP